MQGKERILFFASVFCFVLGSLLLFADTCESARGRREQRQKVDISAAARANFYSAERAAGIAELSAECDRQCSVLGTAAAEIGQQLKTAQERECRVSFELEELQRLIDSLTDCL